MRQFEFAFQGVRGQAGLLATIALAILVTGCSGSSERRSSAAETVAPQVRAPVAEVEPDGLPSQAPPRVKAAQAADDPSEPFSRNYGVKTAVGGSVGGGIVPPQAPATTTFAKAASESTPRTSVKTIISVSPRRKPTVSAQAQMAQAYCLDESARGCGGRR